VNKLFSVLAALLASASALAGPLYCNILSGMESDVCYQHRPSRPWVIEKQDGGMVYTTNILHWAQFGWREVPPVFWTGG